MKVSSRPAKVTKHTIRHKMKRLLRLPALNIVAAVLLLGCLPTMCVATIPFVPYGTNYGDTRLPQFSAESVVGPFPAPSHPSPMVFENGGGQETQYY
ncbi:membrane-associated protein, putative, partial [Bodo saltans]